MGNKAIFSTTSALDSNSDTDLEEVGTLREHHGIIYRWVLAGATGWSAKMGLVESTNGTDTTLIPAPVGTTKPIVAISQSTVTAAYYGWVIWQGKASVYADESVAANMPIVGAGPGGTAGYVRGTFGEISKVYSRTGAGASGTAITVSIR
jgi:hypothetical protein